MIPVKVAISGQPGTGKTRTVLRIAKMIEDKLYIRTDIGYTHNNFCYGLSEMGDLGGEHCSEYDEQDYWDNPNFYEEIDMLYGVGYKMDLNDYLKTKKNNPYIMFELTKNVSK